MKLFEALALRKSLEQQIVELVELRSDTFEYPMDEVPEFRFYDLTEKIKSTVNKLVDLKVLITKANLETKLPNGLTLYEGILELGGIRAAIGQLKSLLKVGDRFGYGRTRRTTVQEIRTNKQLSSEGLLVMIQKYEVRRRTLDAYIQEANHNTEIDFAV